MAKKKADTGKSKTPKEELVKVRVLKDYDGFKKGDIRMVPERKIRASARELRKGFIKPV